MAIGLDVNDLTLVINYGLPDDTENYTHRSGTYRPCRPSPLKGEMPDFNEEGWARRKPKKKKK